VNILYSSEEWRGEQRTSHPGDKIYPWGTTSRLGSKFSPKGEVKNEPLISDVTIPRDKGDHRECRVRPHSRVRDPDPGIDFAKLCFGQEVFREDIFLEKLIKYHPRTVPKHIFMRQLCIYNQQKVRKNNIFKLAIDPVLFCLYIPAETD
jgi:hypothetical protein